MNCLNCGNDFEGKYCPQCSQKSSTRRLTVVSVFRDFMNAISDSDKGFLKTVIDLSQNPGKTINNYISGKRARYLSAGKYTFFITVLFTLNVTYLENHFGMFETLIKGLDKAEVLVDESTNNIHITDKKGKDKLLKEAQEKKVSAKKQTSKSDENPNKQKAYGVINAGETIELNFDFLGYNVDKSVSKKSFLQFLQDLIPHYHRTLFDYLKFLIFLWVPIFSLFSFLFFWKAPYNFAEHITFNTYIFSHTLLIFVVISPAYWFMPQMNLTTLSCSLFASSFYVFFSYMQFFVMRPKRLIKTAITLSVSFITYATVLSILVTGLAFYIALENIHLLK